MRENTIKLLRLLLFISDKYSKKKIQYIVGIRKVELI
jgi:hypothetical protein